MRKEGVESGTNEDRTILWGVKIKHRKDTVASREHGVNRGLCFSKNQSVFICQTLISTHIDKSYTRILDLSLWLRLQPKQAHFSLY